MSAWYHESCYRPGIPIRAERFADDLPDDDDDPSLDVDSSPPDAESERIVEEAIRRLEEAEHEWARSWEPEKSSE